MYIFKYFLLQGCVLISVRRISHVIVHARKGQSIRARIKTVESIGLDVCGFLVKPFKACGSRETFSTF
ncbi:hypothetical protein AR158_c249R [Paramecium bursaria Chlorella virus AR158]|uniref:hypothetical protein n=1 Tax=Paramecium bursaria Chlorella virus AR158 TaxID=380598 RepID=UPI00015AA8AD|nr:hypothetical protein AR158_c249R [Paramecium bursaria Chlorella virus AR158]ABU43794.1 hypothetical protein AR158_c249R [Paramecium bursaria Chlorella virus AR158]